MIQSFYINLRTRKDKRKFIESQFQEFKNPPKRVIAIRSLRKVSKNVMVTPQVAACWLSHEKVYGILKKSKINSAIILEDDAKIDKDIIRNWNSLILKFEASDLDCLQIGYLDIGIRNKILRKLHDISWIIEILFLRFLMSLSPIDSLIRRTRVRRAKKAFQISSTFGLGFLKPDDFLPGTHSYLIKKDFAMKLIDINSPIVFSADQLFMSISKMKSFEIWRTTKNFSTQETNFKSDIGEDRFLIYSKLKK
jgi:GR25 family glycosyltransferase involved in LPS biosynthesis